MTRRRVLAIALCVIVAGAAGVTALAAYLVHARQDRILGAVGRNLGRTVHAERLGVSLRGGFGVALHEVAVGEDPAFGSGPFLTTRTVAMRLRLLPLLARHLVFDGVLVDEPVVNLVRDAAGHLNVETFGQRHRKGKQEDATAAKAPTAFQIASLRLRHGTINYLEQATGRRFALSDVAVDAREPHFAAPIPISVRAALAGKDLRLDDIVSEGVLDLSTEPPAYGGTLHAGPGALGQLPLERLEATVRAQAPDMTLEAAKVTLLGGEVTGTATVASAGASAGFRAQGAGRGLDVAQLPARKDRPHPAGTLSFDGSFSGPPPGAGDLKTTLAGTGKFAVADGRVVGANVGPVVLDLLRPVIGGAGTDRLQNRYPDLFGGDDLRFTQLSGSGRLREGRVYSEDLVLASASYDARGKGSLGLDGDVDLALDLAASPALTEDLLGRSKARPLLVGTDGRLTIPLHVRGPIQHPRVTPDAEFATRLARGVLGGTGLEETAGSLLQQLLGKRKKGR